MICESWTNNLSNIDIPVFDYHAIYRPRGVVVYMNNILSASIKMIKQGPIDMIWFSIQKVFFSLKRDIFFCLCYEIPTYSSHQVYLEQDMYDIIVEENAI